jgi:signal transduction histidine kinase
MYDIILLFKTSEIYSAIMIVTIILIILAVGFVVFIVNFKIRQGLHSKEKLMMEAEFEKQLMQSQIEVQEMTMEDLGKELHDNVGQLLSSAKLLLGVSQRVITDETGTLKLTEDTISSAIVNLRSLTRSLDREWLQLFDFITNLETEVDRIRGARTMIVNFDYPETLPLDAASQLILFRIVQEALHNTIKHARATVIDLKIQVINEQIIVAVRDNGEGFISGDIPQGLGIKNMKHRTKLLGGAIDWKSSPEGSEVNISLPYNASANG